MDPANGSTTSADPVNEVAGTTEPEMGDLIDGVKVIHANTYNFDQPDDEALPFKLEMNLNPPEFMKVAFMCMFGGSEELTVRAESLEALNSFIEKSHLRPHPRARRATITGPDGVLEEWGYLTDAD